MQWIAPSEKDSATTTLEARLWEAADQLRANSDLKAQQYSGPILGLIFLRLPKYGLPRCAPGWRPLAAPIAVAAAWMTLLPTKR